ncbi:helix-turn-helix transcriptional regulator [Streptomyces shenzhenensis]|uniref:helix-turn-helix transcriptional regulator n=1 Tax=Streptomyces shenzhenensis TaxID=943815 RepID=UPI0037F6949F
MSDDPRRELADFLRTRRTRLRPQDVGLEPGPRRRVAGLRREELALLAGVSSDYYQRMEQGRDVRPSEQVLDALAGALNFSAEETRHLHSLAAAARTPVRLSRAYEPEAVPDTTLRVMRGMTSPALVVGRFLDVLAWNPLGGALLGEFTRQPQRERNLLALFLRPEADRTCPNRAATIAELIGMLRTQIAADQFLRPEADRTCPNRAATIAELIGMLRTQIAADPGHPRAVELVGELALRSDEFAALWALHDVAEPTRGQISLNHHQVGELNLDWDVYPIPGNLGPALMVCTAAEGSPDAARLRMLADLVGTP